MTDEKITLMDVGEAETHAQELYKTKVVKAEKIYNTICSFLQDKLQAASPIKVGSRVKIAKGFTYAGRKAVVRDIGFLFLNDYRDKFRDAAARMVLLKKDETESKITTISSLVNLEKI